MSEKKTSSHSKKKGRWSHLLKEFPKPSSTTDSQKPDSRIYNAKKMEPASSQSSDIDQKINGDQSTGMVSNKASKKIKETPVAFRTPGVSTDKTIFSVSDVTRKIKGQLESEFKRIWVQGEISNFKAHSSGHYYFSLKDSGAQLNAVMFKGFNNQLKFVPESGMEVVARGKITVYEPRGNYQIFCESMEPVGAGALQKAFEQLKEKLKKEGLFEELHKKALPSFPKKVAVITSPTGAAVRDILNVMGRRSPNIEVTILPARVQGDRAAKEIAQAIEMANTFGDFQVLIVGRGGGSLEDLWPFNEEIVGRAIFESKIPVISAVGHEVDFSISDFVADLRAPTPSAAAELVCRNSEEVRAKIASLHKALVRAQKALWEKQKARLLVLEKSLVSPKQKLHRDIQKIDELNARLFQSVNQMIRNKKIFLSSLKSRIRNPAEAWLVKKNSLSRYHLQLIKEQKALIDTKRKRLATSMAVLNSLSPLKVLGRGYGIVRNENGEVISQVENLAKKQRIKVRLSDGEFESTVDTINILKRENS